MAHMTRLSDLIKGGVVGESLQEGRAVKVTNSGIHQDLPILMAADTDALANVHVLMAVPDQFTRPTRSDLYKAPWYTTQPQTTGYGSPVDENVTYYRVGKSVLWNPTITSGELGQAHRGGSYAVQSGAYVMSAGIKVPGSLVKVTTGRWETTTDETKAVGTVDEYNSTLDVLCFTLKQ